MATTETEPSNAGALELFANIVANAPVPIFLKDRAGVYLYVNDAYVAQDSSGLEEIVGHTDSDRHPEEVAASYRRDDLAAMESETPIETVRPSLVNGEPRMYKTVKFPIHATDGQILGVCGISLDITDTLLEEEAQEAEHQRDIAAKPFERLFASLTAQEARVAELLSLGYSDKEIAESLYLTPDTVRHHVSHLLKKLKKRSRTQAVIEILRHRRAP